MGPFMVEAGTSHALFRKELQHTLDWAEEHASSLAEILSSYETRVDTFRQALNALDSFGVSAAITKDIDELAIAAPAVSFDLVEHKACDPSQIELSVEQPDVFVFPDGVEPDAQDRRPGRCDSMAPQTLGRHSVSELLAHGSLGETEQSQISSWLQYLDVGHWDWMVSMCESLPFQCSVGAAILVSTVFIAYDADMEMASLQERRQDTTADFRNFVDKTIIGCFVLEAIMKILAYRLGFFIGSDWRWNMFDASTAIASVFEIVAEIIGGGSSVAGIMRPLRSLKLLRMVKLLKFLSRSRELRLIAANLVNCSASLFWTLTLVISTTYLFACIFLQAWTSRARNDNGLPSDVFKDWGSTRAVMLNLFAGATGGKDWCTTAEPLWEDLGAPYYFLFVAHIVFFVFVIANIITSLIVETVLSHSGKDDNDVAMQHLKKRHEYVEKVTNIFKDMGGGSEVSLDVFREHLCDTSMVAFAEELDAEPLDLEHLFELLSNDGRHNVDVDTFVVSCIRMRGAAKSIDMMDTLSTLVRLDRKHIQFEESTAQSLDRLQKDVHGKLNILLQQTQKQRRNEMQIQTKKIGHQ